MVSASFTDEQMLSTAGYGLIPPKFSTAAYEYLFTDLSQLLVSFGVTLTVTVVGTGLGLLVMSLCAYALSRRAFRFRSVVGFIIFFTLLFNGGLISSYILITQYLNLKNTILVLILPYVVLPWLVLLLKAFFSRLPEELLDAARVDGANEWRIFFTIVLPLSTPALATVGLFHALIYWNDWWLALLYIDNRNLEPLQFMLHQVMTSAERIPRNPYVQFTQPPVQSVRMALALIATAPIVIAFLSLQNYFVRGIALGGLKDG